MDLKNTIKNNLKKIGAKTVLRDQNSNAETEFYASIQKRPETGNRGYVPKIYGEGEHRGDFYNFFGPFDVDVTNTGDYAEIEYMGKTYLPYDMQELSFANEVIAYCGVLRAAEEADYE